MKVSFFETARYRSPRALPSEWPMPSGAYHPEAGAEAYRSMIERLEYVEELGFDWVSVSEHHYAAQIIAPSTGGLAGALTQVCVGRGLHCWARLRCSTIPCARLKRSRCLTISATGG